MVRKLRILGLAVLISLGGTVYAQRSSQPLTNDGVVEMVKGGLSEAIIVGAIQAQATHFDVSAPALINLQRQGVSPQIMDAMMAATRRQESVTAPRATAAQPQQQPSSSERAPALSPRSDLPSLASARHTQDKCDVLLSWLQTGKASAPAGRPSYGLPPQMIEIFRDEYMKAVFGTTYDQTDNRWRIDQYENVFSPCLGEFRPRGRAINIGGFNLAGHQHRLPPEYPQQFGQYRELISQAFQGLPGRYEPTTVTRYVQGVRQQIGLANSEMTSAATAAPTLDSFKQLGENRSGISQQLALLRPAERDLVSQYLSRRQSEMAPAIIESWIHNAEQDPKAPESAQALQAGRRGMSEVLGKLDPSARASADASYERLIEADISQAVGDETAKLASFPATWEGAQQMAAWESAFLDHFGQFRSTNAFGDATAQFESARTRLDSSLLPSWQAKVAAMPAQTADISARRAELETIFPTPADRSTPLYKQFEESINTKEAEMQARIAEEERKRLAEAERAAAVEAQKAAARNTPAANLGSVPQVQTGPLSATDLKAGAGPNGEMLQNLYMGQFDKIAQDRASGEFQAVVSGYIEGFSQSCRNYIRDPVELTREVCDSEWVTRNGYGTEISRSCASYHTEGTGVYAERSLYAASNSSVVQQATSGFRQLANAMSGGNILGGIANMAMTLGQLSSDAKNLVVANGCTSPALARFEGNLERFALGKEGVRLDGTVAIGVAMLPAAPGETYRDSDYARVLEDMVGAQSKTWSLNQYIAGSIRGAEVRTRDASGRPAEVTAGYTYKGFSNMQQGTVRLTFDGGRPTCLYFSDFPSVCRTPDHRLIADYTNGKYR
jgi:hypothetical protein